MPASPLVIDANNNHGALGILHIEDSMRFNGKSSDTLRQFRGVAADIREVAETLKRGVELLAVRFPLLESPPLDGVISDIAQIRLRGRGEAIGHV